MFEVFCFFCLVSNPPEEPITEKQPVMFFLNCFNDFNIYLNFRYHFINYVSILAIVNYRNWLDASPPSNQKPLSHSHSILKPSVLINILNLFPLQAQHCTTKTCPSESVAVVEIHSSGFQR